jgi:hypothetical protein
LYEGKERTLDDGTLVIANHGLYACWIFEVLVTMLKLEIRAGVYSFELAHGTGMSDDKLPAGWDMTYSVRRFYRVGRILELSE